MSSALFLPPSPSAPLPRAGSPCAGLFLIPLFMVPWRDRGIAKAQWAAPRSLPMLPVFCRARDDHMGGLCPIGMTKTFKRGHLPKGLTALSADPEPIRAIQKYSKPLCHGRVKPGQARPSTQLRRHLPAVPNLGNIISALITWFSVLVDGRFKPGQARP
jgi:hypothetical protein